MRTKILLSLLLAAPLTAQAVVVSVPDSDPTAGTCNVIPFGSSAGSSFNNVRAHHIVTAADIAATGSVLPLVCGLRFASCSTSVRQFDQLTVRMGHIPAGTGLSSVYAVNLPAGSGTTVLDARNYVWRLEADTWNDIGLQVPFVYNQVDDIVIEVISINSTVISTSGGSLGFHRGTQPRVYSTNYTGAQTSGSLSNSSSKIQLHFAEASTGTFGLGCPGTSGATPELTYTGVPTLGGSFDIDLNGGPVTSAAVLFIGVFTTPPWPVDLGIIGAPGCSLYHNVIGTLSAGTDAAGSAAITIAPVSGVPCEFPIYTQWACIDPGANAIDLTTSNYGRFLIGF